MEAVAAWSQDAVAGATCAQRGGRGVQSMATVVVWKKGGWGGKALGAVLDNEANISAGKADEVPSSTQKAKWFPSKNIMAKAVLVAAAASSPGAASADAACVR